MENPRRVQCGQPECKRQYVNETQRNFQRKHRAETGKRYSSRYRERELEYYKLRRETLPHWRKRYPEVAALSDARRRALIEQAVKGEPFAPKDVYERDQWTCGLCRQPVDPGLAWPHPMSASVDHIVPLSRGGEHSMGNVQCAHLSCNARKCDQMIEEINEVESIISAMVDTD
ncbi:HNH endonuclease [Streptomyces melanosporofaciens]